jgi:hypothetical protein
MQAISELYRQAREGTNKLHEAPQREICLAISEGEIGQVQKILDKKFVPDVETLNAAAAGISTAIFRLIADAGHFSDMDFENAYISCDPARKEHRDWVAMRRTIHSYCGRWIEAERLLPTQPRQSGSTNTARLLEKIHCGPAHTVAALT